MVRAIVRPETLGDVLKALYQADVAGFTVSRVQGHGGEAGTVETYRGTSVKMDLTEKVMIDIGVSVLPLEGVHRIRTAEKGTAAVTPVAP